MSFTSRPLTLSLALATALALAACAAPRPPRTATPPKPAAPPAVQTQPVAPPAAVCNPAPAQSAVGKTADATLVEQARQQSGARVARVLRPGQMVTMEFSGERLNLAVDAKGKVTRVTCG